MLEGRRTVRITEVGPVWRAETLEEPRLVTFGATKLEAERALIRFWRDVVREEMTRAVRATSAKQRSLLRAG